MVEYQMVRSESVEAMLNRMCIPFRYHKEVPIEDIDEAASLRTQARLDRVDQEHVTRFVSQAEAGDLFPAIIVEGRARHGGVILDGVHRFLAWKQLACSTIACYWVTIEDAKVRELLVRITNMKNGEPLGAEEKIKQGVYLVTVLGLPATTAAAELGCPYSTLKRAIAREGLQNRAVSLGMDVSSLPISVQEVLATIKSAPVLIAAANFAKAVSAPSDMMQTMLRAARDEPSEAQQRAKLDEFRDSTLQTARMQRATIGKAQRSPTTRLRLLLGQLNALLDRCPTAAQMDLNSQAARDEILEKWATLTDKIDRVTR